jgi:hypothetical protein
MIRVLSAAFRSMLARRRPDFFIALLLALTALITGMGFLVSPAGQSAPLFPPGFLSTAVMIAEGRGFIYPVIDAHPALTEFERRERYSIARGEVPEDIELWTPEVFRGTHRYLLYAVGYTWMLFGTNWGAARLLLAFFFAVSTILAYMGFRLFLGRFFSAAGALLFALSPPVISALPYLRDFSKTPWIFGGLLILGLLLRRHLTRRQLMIYAALLGLTAGIGFGYRQDLLIVPPAALIALLFFVRGDASVSIRWRILAAVLFLMVFYVPARPVFRATEEAGSLFFHNIINGLGTPHEEYMGLDAPSYETVYTVNDNYSHALRTTYVRRVLEDKRLIYNEGHDAAWAGKQFVKAAAAYFPADFLTRGLGTIRFLIGRAADATTAFADPESVFLNRQHVFYGPLAAHLQQFGVVYAAFSLILISFRDLRLAWALFFGLFYFCGYPALQLQMRHCFHLVIFGIGFFLFFWSRAGRGAAALIDTERRTHYLAKRRQPETAFRPVLKRLALFALPALALIVIPLFAARLYQYIAVGRLLEAYYAAEKTPLGYEKRPCERLDLEGWTVIDTAPLPRPEIETRDAWEWRAQEHYIALAFEGDVSGRPIHIWYETETSSNDFSGIVNIGPASEVPGKLTYYFFPVFEFPVSRWLGVSHFEGVFLPPDLTARLAGVYRVTDLENLPLLLNLTLPPDPGDFRRYRRL